MKLLSFLVIYSVCHFLVADDVINAHIHTKSQNALTKFETDELKSHLSRFFNFTFEESANARYDFYLGYPPENKKIIAIVDSFRLLSRL